MADQNPIDEYWLAEADKWMAEGELCAVCGAASNRYHVITRGKRDGMATFWFCSPAHTDQWKQENPF
jgi:hypothetical protein